MDFIICLYNNVVIIFFFFFKEEQNDKILSYISLSLGIIGILISCYIHKNSESIEYYIIISVFTVLAFALIHIYNTFSYNFCLFTLVYMNNFAGLSVSAGIGLFCCTH